MVSRRDYFDGCAAAHALDLVGERWALLVVRELMLGPKRFTDLREGLPHASANVLSQRLRDLEEAGVVQRRRLPPPAASAVYELTDWGLDLEPVLQALGRWGVRSPSKPPSNDIGLDSFVLALRTMFDPATAGDLDTTVELHLGDQTFRACVSGGVLTVERGRAAGPAAVVTGDVGGLAAVTFGGLPVREARLGGLLSVEGDEPSVASFTRCFPLPQPAPSFTTAAATS